MTRAMLLQTWWRWRSGPRRRVRVPPCGSHGQRQRRRAPPCARACAEWLDAAGADVVCSARGPGARRGGRGGVRAAGGRGPPGERDQGPRGRRDPVDTPRGATYAVVGASAGGGALRAAHTGRWVEATVDSPPGDVRVVSVYVHSGEAGTPTMDDKYAFLDAHDGPHGASSRRPYDRVVVMGDINIAHTRTTSRTGRATSRPRASCPRSVRTSTVARGGMGRRSPHARR